MADGLGLFGKNNRNKERKNLGSILDSFHQMKTDLSTFVDEKMGHVSRLNTALTKLESEKQQAAQDMEKAIITRTNIEKLMGEGSNP